MVNFEIYFLWALALVWIIFAVINDLRFREISNWLNLSLAVFALGFRFFYSWFEMDSMTFFYQGLIGLGIFVVLGNLFYYGKMFAGGDAKLMMALGAVLPIYYNFYLNLKFFFLFLTVFLMVGAVYGILVSLYFGIRNFSRFRKEFLVQFKKKKYFVMALLFFSSVFLIVGFFSEMFFYFGIFFFIMPYFYLYVKSVDEACMVRNIRPSKLTEGDWLYENVKVGSKIIKATWDGISKDDIKLLKKKDRVLVRYGIQFAPVFFFAFVITFLIFKFGLF